MQTLRAPTRRDPGAEARVVGEAVTNVGRRLDLSQSEVAKIIGVSNSTYSRVVNGAADITPDTKPFELAVLLIRLFRSLDAIMGGDDKASASWLRNYNHALGGRPVDRIQTIDGLIETIAHVDAFRALV